MKGQQEALHLCALAWVEQCFSSFLSIRVIDLRAPNNAVPCPCLGQTHQDLYGGA